MSYVCVLAVCGDGVQVAIAVTTRARGDTSALGVGVRGTEALARYCRWVLEEMFVK
jgi:hypothetical protein